MPDAPGGTIGSIGSVVVNFVGDDTQYQQVQQRVTGTSTQASQTIATAATAPQNAINVLSLYTEGLAAKTASSGAEALKASDFTRALTAEQLGMGASAAGASGSSDKLRDALGLTRTEIGAGSKAFRTLAADIAGMDPAIGGAIASITGIIKLVTSMPVAFGVGAAAILAIGLAMKTVFENASALYDAQLKANEAVLNMDFSGAQSQLDSVAKSMREYDFALEKMDDDSAPIAQRIIAEFKILGSTFTDFGGQAQIAANATLTLWENFERERQSLTLNKDLLEDQAKSFKKIADGTTDIGTMTAALENEALTTRKIADNTVALKDIDNARINQKIQNELDALSTAGKWEEWFKLMDVLEEQEKNQATQRARTVQQAEDALAKARADNAKAVAEYQAKQIEVQALLTQNADQMALAADAQARAEIEAKQKVLQADQQYYGQTRTGAEEYYAALRANIDQTYQDDVKRIKDRSNADLQELTVRRDALKPYGQGWTDLNNQITQKDADTNLELTKRSNQYKNDVTANQNDIVTAVRNQTEANVKLQSDYYNQLKALGLSDTQDHLAQLRATAADDSLSYATRVKANTDLYAEIRRLDSEYQTLIRANGQQTVADNVAFAGAMVLTWKDAKEERLKAETDFANQVKSLWEGIANAGKATFDFVANQMKTMFGPDFQMSAANVNQWWDQAVLKAQQYGDQLARGGGLTDQQRQLLEQVAKIQGDMAAKGITASEAILGYTTNLNNMVHGLLPSTGQLVNNMENMNVPLGKAGQAAQAMQGDLQNAVNFSEQLPGAIDPIVPSLEKAGASAGEIKSQIGSSIINAGGLEGAIDAVGDSLGRLPQAATDAATGIEASLGGDGLKDAFKRGLDGGLGVVKDFLANGKTAIDQGVSEWGEAVVGGITNKLRATLDAETSAA